MASRSKNHANGKLLSKGDPMTEHEYSNHNQRTRAKFQSMINNKGVIADEFKTKKFAQRLLLKSGATRGQLLLLHRFQMILFIMSKPERQLLGNVLECKLFQIGISLLVKELQEE